VITVNVACLNKLIRSGADRVLASSISVQCARQLSNHTHMFSALTVAEFYWSALWS